MNRQVLLRFLLLLGLVLQPNHGGALAACSSALSGASGAQLEINVYYPFGRTQTATPQASCQVSRRFTGQVFDAESGLYYYNARYYDPELGRFIQPDDEIPDFSNPQSYNHYSYCINDPLRYNDPTGHDPTLAISFAAARSSEEERRAVARTAVPVVVGGAVALVTAGAATPLLIGAGASATVAAIGSGVAAGAMGDLAAQATQTGLGTRQSISGKEAAVSAAVGGALAGTASTAGKLASALSGPAAEGGVLSGANYAQRTFSSTFSSGGTFAGQTVEDVAAQLRAGTLTPADVPIQYIVQDGNTLMLNTRSAQALEQAGMPRSAWNAVDMTGDAAAQARLAAQLQRNGLGSQGIPTVTPSGH